MPEHEQHTPHPAEQEETPPVEQAAAPPVEQKAARPVCRPPETALSGPEPARRPTEASLAAAEGARAFQFEKDPHALWFLIQSGIDRAFDSRRDIDDTTARLIALLLAPGTFSNLALFAQGATDGPHTTHTALRVEYLPAYWAPDTPEEIRGLIDWLGTYLIHRDNPATRSLSAPVGPPHLGNLLWHTSVPDGDTTLEVQVRGDCPAEVIDALPDELAAFIDARGNAARAFLTLRDVDATSPHLTESFDSAFRGEFATENAAIEQLLELDSIHAAIDTIAENYRAGCLVELDHDGLHDLFADDFDIVDLGGRSYVFDK